MAKSRFFSILSIVLIISSIFSSCSEGLFNFTDETGNISIEITIDSSVSAEVDRVVINLNNQESGDSLRKEPGLYFGESGKQQAESYISRVDTGFWNMQVYVYNTDNEIIGEYESSFELKLAKTVIAEITYYDSGLEVVWTKPVGDDPESLLDITAFDTMIYSMHEGGTSADLLSLTSINIIAGTGLETAMDKFRIEYPDNGYFEYSGGWSRSVTNIEVELGSAYLTTSRPDYTAKGNYHFYVEDLNGVETELDDSCWFDFDPATGAATISGVTSYASGHIDTDMYEKNGSGNAGTYIYYIVEEAAGTHVHNNTLYVNEDPSSAGILTFPTTPMTLDCYVVLATIDADLTDTEVNDAFISGTTNLSPSNFPGWLYASFGDRINFIGMSVEEHTFP